MIKKKVTKIFAAFMMTAVLFSSVGIDVHAASTRVTMRESEPNNTKEAAELIEANSETAYSLVEGTLSGRFEVDGNTSETDPDWFKVYLDAGTQYMTCYIEPFSFLIEDEVGNVLLNDIYTYADTARFGRTAYGFNVPKSGYYYVKILGCDSSSKQYEFTVGGPIYDVSRCEIPCNEGMVNMTSSVKMKTVHFQGVESDTMPKDAIAYYVRLSGVKSQAIKSARLTNEKSGLSVELSKYSWRKDKLASMNMKVESMWTAKLEYNETTSFTPVLEVLYAYPVYSTMIQRR
ncbi:MAG: hypothetical protein K2M91_09280 [Lachnospiraceae bacterium]|nr:hypothetical protein [Lachnospiraceae bacterium]